MSTPRFFVDPDITKAKTLSTDFYTDPEVFAESKEKIFSRCWHFLGSSAQLPNPGDMQPLTLLDPLLNEPLLLSRDLEGELHLLSNACTHRGNLVCETPGNARQLRCRYHGRRFELNGKFAAMPEFKDVKDFPSEDDNLKQLPLHDWEGLLFGNLTPGLDHSLFFKEMMERVSWMPLKDFKYRREMGREFEVEANWALYCENYLEGFHIPFVHPGLNEVIGFGDYSTEIFYPYASLQLGIGKNPRDCFDLPEGSPDTGKNIAAYYFWVFPNMMFNFYPWGLSINIVQPVDPSKCRVQYLSYVWDGSKLGSGAGAALDRVEMEDEEIVQQVQKGICSRFYTHGRYSPTREQGTHHFHRLLAEFM